MPTLLIDSITINREQRQRRELKNIPELAASIAEIGLINPIVVTEDHVLMAGERRLEAVRSLGWDSISVTVFSDLSPAQQQLLELEENVKREELAWKDHCAAVAQYHRLRLAEDEEWTQAQSADALGVSRQHIHNRLAVQEALEAGEPLVVAADKYSVARGIVERKRQRSSAQDTEVANNLVNKMISPAVDATALPTGETGPEEEGELGGTSLNLGFTLLHESFHDWITTTDERGFNFIHCDFPYGVNAGKHAAGAAGKFGGYEDTEDVYWRLLDALKIAMDTGIVADSAHLMFWFSMDFYTETKHILEAMGWKVNPFPLYWFKSDNSGILPDPKRGPRRNTETAFLASRDDRFIVQAVSNTFAGPNTKEIHMSEKPMDMLAHFFRMFVDGTTKMLDPTMGSANAVRVAYEAGASSATGLEMDETFFLNACHAHDDLMGG